MRSRVLSSRFRESVLITTKAGTTFAGVLYSCDRQAVVLRAASAVGAGESNSNLVLDGEIIILLADIAYIQRP